MHEETLLGNSQQPAQWIRRTRRNFFPISSSYHIAKFHFREEAKQIKTCTNKFPLTTPTWKTNSNCRDIPIQLLIAKIQTNMQKTTNVWDLGRNPQAEGKQLQFSRWVLPWGCCGDSRGKHLLLSAIAEGQRFDLLFFWSLTVHFINWISLRAGLEGLAFPPSWAQHWDALGGLPPHYLDQQLQTVIAGDGQTLWALFGLMSGCSNPSGLESRELNSLGTLGNAWDRQMSLHPCAALLGSLPAREEPGLEGQDGSCHGQTLNRIMFSPGL